MIAKFRLRCIALTVIIMAGLIGQVSIAGEEKYGLIDSIRGRVDNCSQCSKESSS